ncbi:uracil-DNA glycosylase family protein [Algoriella xinjiangensis]
MKQSFLPILSNEPRILILGSLPGDLSIKKNQYYAHPQNRFWKILEIIKY